MNCDARPVILHVVNSLEGGGTEGTLIALLRAFDPTRFRHVVVTLRGAGSLSARLPDNVACRPINARDRSWSTGLKLADVARAWRAGLIHARNTGCWRDAVIAGVLAHGARLVLGFHGLETPGPFSGRQRRCARAALLVGARFTTVSETGRHQLHCQAGVPVNRIKLLRNGVDPGAFAPLDEATRRRTRAAFQFDDSTLVVGTVGSLTPVKQHATLIRAVARAAKRLPNIRLLIVGKGPLLTALMRQADVEGIGSRVRFAGWRDDVPLALGCMDVYVCSSASEGMNNALLEAMAAALPIIATDVGDNAAMLRDGVEGRIVEPGSVTQIVEALGVLASGSEIRHRFAAAARARARDYDFNQTVRAYEAYYRAVLSGNLSRRSCWQGAAGASRPTGLSPQPL